MTPKYIDINKIAITSESFLDSDGDALVSVNDLKRAIRQATVEDVVPVVRCKECSKFMTVRCPMYNINYPEDFCSKGERKDGDKQ